MSEKKFLNFVLTEGIILFIVSLCMLILPKLTEISLGIILCFAFFIYGVFKMISAYIARNYIRHFCLNIILGTVLALLGLVLFFKPTINFAMVTSIIGIYLLLESLSLAAFTTQTKKIFSMWWVNMPVIFIMSLSGLIIILSITNIAFWLVSLIVGLNYLLLGNSLIKLYISNKYVF